MTPQKKPQKETGWKVLRMRGAGTVSLDLVHAVDQADALGKVIEKYDIAPALKNRIIVRPWK